MFALAVESFCKARAVKPLTEMSISFVESEGQNLMT